MSINRHRFAKNNKKPESFPLTGTILNSILGGGGGGEASADVKCQGEGEGTPADG